MPGLLLYLTEFVSTFYISIDLGYLLRGKA